MLYEDNYLAHYGVKGQRWGVRRYQNQDGTLTAEGRSQLEARRPRTVKQQKASAIRNLLNNIGKGIGKKVKEVTDKRKPVSKMTDQELRERLNRMNMESQYERLNKELYGKPKKEKKNFAQKHPNLDRIIVGSATTAMASIVTRQINTKADELLAPRRMSRAEANGMLDEKVFPFVYNNSGRITSYNNLKKRSGSA